MIKTPICEMLGIEYPIFQGGMAWIADGRLAAAVSEGGGLGIISAMNAGTDYLKREIDICRSLTKKPFGVNVMLMSPHVEEVAKLLAEEKVPVITTGAGNPGKYMKLWQSAGIRVIPVVASVAMAKLVTRQGACAVIAEGGESGGHVGDLTTMALLPQVCDATPLPVIGAGGIADGRGVAAAFMLRLAYSWEPVFWLRRNAAYIRSIKIRSSRQKILIQSPQVNGWAIQCAA